MHFNIYVNNQLGHHLTEYAEKKGITRNKLIHQVLTKFIQNEKQDWSEVILQFKGIPDFPVFEESRLELLPPKEDPFA